MSLFPLFTTNVRAKAPKSRILGLILHLFVLIKLIRAELTHICTIRRSSSHPAPFRLRALPLHLKTARGGHFIASRSGHICLLNILLIVKIPIPEKSQFVNGLDLSCQIWQVFIQETIVIIGIILLRCTRKTHLLLEVHLHSLQLLHLLGQLAQTALVPVHGHHLGLLLQKNHLLLHHVHLHLNRLSIDLRSRSILVLNLLLCLSLSDVHDRGCEVLFLAELPEERLLAVLPLPSHHV